MHEAQTIPTSLHLHLHSHIVIVSILLFVGQWLVVQSVVAWYVQVAEGPPCLQLQGKCCSPR